MIYTVQFEAFEAVASGTYALQPISLTQGGLTAYEEVMAGWAPAA